MTHHPHQVIPVVTSHEIISTSCGAIDEAYYSVPVRKCPVCKSSDMAVKKKKDGWCV